MIFHKSNRFYITILLIIVLAGLILTYTYFQSINLINGPTVTILTPQDGFGTTSPTIYVIGIAKNVKNISLNGRPIFINEEGDFGEKLVLLPGYNIITIEAKDRFDREIKKTIEVVRK